jgi:hypothetical protein
MESKGAGSKFWRQGQTERKTRPKENVWQAEDLLSESIAGQLDELLEGNNRTRAKLYILFISYAMAFYETMVIGLSSRWVCFDRLTIPGQSKNWKLQRLCHIHISARLKSG